jgi:hypothetical protein
MTIDLYTKAVLTVIAVALWAIAVREPGPAIAQASICGDSKRNACYVRGTVEVEALLPLPVMVMR